MQDDYLGFIENIKRKTGIDLSLYKEAQMKRRLTSLRIKRGYHNFSDYFKALSGERELLLEFLDRMTINVSEFYRNRNRWEVLEQKVLPNLIKKDQTVKIWSAACSHGEEPYTIGMILSKYLPQDKIKIIATDIDESALEHAKVGVYSSQSLREVPDDVQKKYFTKLSDHSFQVKDEIKRLVTFKKQNLLADPFEKNFDLVVCRNVLIYFTEEAKEGLYHKFSESLKPSGVFFVGSTEQIFYPANYGFEVIDSFFYRKK